MLLKNISDKLEKFINIFKTDEDKEIYIAYYQIDNELIDNIQKNFQKINDNLTFFYNGRAVITSKKSGVTIKLNSDKYLMRVMLSYDDHLAKIVCPELKIAQNMYVYDFLHAKNVDDEYKDVFISAWRTINEIIRPKLADKYINLIIRG